MRILLTGSAGFLGYHLCGRLLADGHRVIGCDNYNDYYYPGLKRARDAELRGAEDFVSLDIDLCRAPDLEQAFAEHEPELVIHLAAQAGVRFSLSDVDSYVRSNLVAFVNLIEAVRRRQVPRLIYASSSSVYGGLAEMPYRENQRTDTPTSLYAATKRSNELIAHTYSHQFGIRTVGLRFFSIYGPWGRPDMAYWIFSEKILAGEPIAVFNFGQMQRDFTYVDDAVEGVARLVALGSSEALGKSEILNVGNGEPVRLLDFVSVLERALDRQAEIQLSPMHTGDVPATHADVSRLQAITGYRPQTPVSVGLPRFVDWYLSQPEIARRVADRRRPA